MSIIGIVGQAPTRWCRLSSNVRQRRTSLWRSARKAAYALNGLSNGTPKDLKSATFRVTTVRP